MQGSVKDIAFNIRELKVYKGATDGHKGGENIEMPQEIISEQRAYTQRLTDFIGLLMNTPLA